MATSTAAASSATVRYAPEDPSLPKPWRGLVDCELGYHYFWNPETNATQFERPLASSSTNPAPSNNAMGSSFLNVRKSHDDGRYSNDGSTKFTRDPSSATGHYALGDPSLPKPWIRLVDGETGFHYFWNPWMNVTQYERPLASSSTSPAPSNNALGFIAT